MRQQINTNWQANCPIISLIIVFISSLNNLARAADPLAYVSSNTQDYVTLFDTLTGKTTKLAPAGLNATSFVISPDGSTAYVARYSQYATPSGGIDIVSVSDGKLLGSIDPNVANSYTNLALTADGSLLYFGGAGQLQVFNTATQTIVAQVPVGPPQSSYYRVALVASGSEIYITSGFGLQAFSTQTLQPVTINGLPKVTGFNALAASPDGTMLYAATPNSRTIVSAIDTATNTVVANIPYSNEGNVLGAAVSPDGQTLYLASPLGLFRLSTVTDTLISQIIATPLDGQIAPSPDGNYVYVNRGLKGFIGGEPDSFGSTFPGLLQIGVNSGTIKNLSIGGIAIAEQIPGASNSLYVVQTLPYIKTEDPAMMAITGTVGLAGGSQVLTASANGAVVAGVSLPNYVTAPASATISVISTAVNKITGQFTYKPPPANTVSPYSFTMNGNGTLGYIGLYDQSAPREQLLVAALNLPSGSVNRIFPINTGGFTVSFLSVSPDGSTLFSLSEAGGLVPISEFCATSLMTLATTGCLQLLFQSPAGQLSGYASAFALSPDGTRAYIPAFLATFAGGKMYLIEVDTKSMTTRATLDVSALAYTYSPSGTMSVLYSSATNSIYLQGPHGVPSKGLLMRVDLGSYTTAATQIVNYIPTSFAITADGTKLLVTGSAIGTQIFDGTTLASIGAIQGGQQQAIVIPKQ